MSKTSTTSDSELRTTPRAEKPRKRMYLLHRWIGLILGLVGALVFFSGAIATFHSELDHWSSRGVSYPAVTEVDGFDLDRAYAIAARGVPDEYFETVDVRQAHGLPLRFFFHKHDASSGQLREVGTAVEIDPKNLEVVSRATGDAQDLNNTRPENALAAWFVELHILLLMPRTLGLTLTGIVGFALLILIITGIWVHKPTREKLARKPRRQRSRVFFGDLHTWIGSWTLPYTFVLAATGAFFSFASVALIPAVAMVAFDGDQEELVRVAIGEVEIPPGEGTAPLQPMLDDALSRSEGSGFASMALMNWRGEGASANISILDHSAFGDRAHQYVYDGHRGTFVTEKPFIGTQPSAGAAAVQLMGDLHFGTLIGIVTKVLWFFFGLLTAFIAISGLWVYVSRQKDPDTLSARLVAVMTMALAGGLPAATAVAVLGWTAGVAMGVGDVHGTLTWSFFITMAAIGAASRFIDSRGLLRLSWAGAGMLFAALPFVAPAASGMSLFGAWSSPDAAATVWVDGALVVTGATLVLAAARMRPRPAHDEVERASTASDIDRLLQGDDD